MSVNIRKAKIEDLEEVLRLNSELFKKEYDEFDKSLDKEWTCSNEGKSYFSDRITKSDGFVVVAEKNGKIVGYLCGGFRFRYCRVKAKHAELENTFIENEYRGIGIGKKLAKAFIDWCDENKVDYIVVTASVGNVEGIEFYKTLGFNEYELTLEMKRK